MIRGAAAIALVLAACSSPERERKPLPRPGSAAGPLALDAATAAAPDAAPKQLDCAALMAPIVAKQAKGATWKAQADGPDAVTCTLAGGDDPAVIQLGFQCGLRVSDERIARLERTVGGMTAPGNDGRVIRGLGRGAYALRKAIQAYDDDSDCVVTATAPQVAPERLESIVKAALAAVTQADLGHPSRPEP